VKGRGDEAVPRWVALWCPSWPVVTSGARPGEAVAVLGSERVVARSIAAAADGVEVGHRRREAQSACPMLRLVAHDPDRDARAFERVARQVADMVPLLEVIEPGLLGFAARGPSRYLGGDDAMAARLVTVVEGAVPTTGCTGRAGVGVADGRFAATVAARLAARDHEWGRSEALHRVVEPGPVATAAFLAPVTVRALTTAAGLDAELVSLLTRLGIRTLGALAALPPASVLDRFGADGAVAHRLATGGDDRRPRAGPPPAELVAVRHLDDPITGLDALVFVARQLAEEVTSSLRDDGRVCTRLVIEAETDHGERSHRLWHRAEGLGTSAMVERARWQLDGWATGAGHGAGTGDDVVTAGVVALRFEAVEVRADAGTQLGLWGGRGRADEWAARAVDRLGALVGEANVVVPTWRGGRQPLDRYRWVPASSVELDDASTRSVGGREAGPWPGRLPPPSPSTVCPTPVPVAVLDAAGRPVEVTGRGLVSDPPAELSFERGGREPITGWAGPWPLEERWWDPGRRRRVARFQLLTGSGRAYLAVVEQQRWWIVARCG
jgi:protein ImuB